MRFILNQINCSYPLKLKIKNTDNCFSTELCRGKMSAIAVEEFGWCLWRKS